MSNAAEQGRRFKRSDMVRLRSGGPAMTVRAVNRAVVTCDWSEGRKTRRESYYLEQLVSAEREISDLETARRIAFILQSAVRAKGKESIEGGLNELLSEILKEDPTT